MRQAAILMLLQCSACPAAGLPERPSEQIVDKIERQLSKLPCPGSLDKWERHYYYASEPAAGGRAYDPSRVDFDLRQAGFQEFKAGRHIHPEMPAPGIDDRRYLIAFGEYDIKADTVIVRVCGWNI